MQLTNLVGLCVLALSSAAAAMPHMGGAYHGDRISVHVPVNTTTGAHNATTTGTKGRLPLTTGLSKAKSNATDSRQGPTVHHVPNHVKHINHCNELCSLESQTCTIAMPEDDKFW